MPPNGRAATASAPAALRIASTPVSASTFRLPRAVSSGSTSENLDELLGKGNYRLARNEEEIQRSVSLGRVGVRLFPWLAMALAVLLGAELAMGHWFYRRATPPNMTDWSTNPIFDSHAVVGR